MESKIPFIIQESAAASAPLVYLEIFISLSFSAMMIKIQMRKFQSN